MDIDNIANDPRLGSLFALLKTKLKEQEKKEKGKSDLAIILNAREQVLWVFKTDSRDTVYNFSDFANKKAREALYDGKVALVLIVFPEAWSGNDEWYNIRTTISHHIQYMPLMCAGSMIAGFGRDDRGFIRENLPMIEEMLGAKLSITPEDIPESCKLVLLIEYYPKWATEGGEKR